MFKTSTAIGICVIFFGVGDGAKILGFLPYPGPSHNLVIMPLFQELAKRGHNVTVAGYYKLDKDIPNYKTILFKRDSSTPLRSFFSIENVDETDYMTNTMTIDKFLASYDSLIPINNNYSDIFGRGNNKEKYDLVIVEYFESDLFLGYVLKLDTPFIVFHTCEPYPWHRVTLGDPVSPSIIPHPMSTRGNSMSFRERFWNTFEITRIMYFYWTVMVPRAQRIGEKFLGALPPLDEVTKNASLYFTYTHFSVFGPKPNNPSTIEVGGLHIAPSKPLPEDIKTLMDGSKNGVVYFSLGSVIKGSTMNQRKRDIIVNVFSELNQTVLWKYEEDMPKKPTNLHISAWFPQRDIIAHPNMVLFIGHCGLLGVYEVISEALPMICMPLVNDQNFNAAAIERLGMGITVSFSSLSEDVLRDAINRALRDPSYRDNAKKVSATFKDRPLSAMDTAVYWTEYVIRHKGAHHMRTPARFMAWWEYYNVDVLATFVVIILIAITIMYATAKMTIKCFLRGKIREKMQKRE